MNERAIKKSMATKFEIEQRIIDNARQKRLGQSGDKLEYLVPVKISEEFLDPDAFSSLRNSWFKKSFYLGFGVILFVAAIRIIYEFVLSLDEYYTSSVYSWWTLVYLEVHG